MALSSSIPELEDVIQGASERLHSKLRRITTLFLDGASRFNEDHVRLFDHVLGSLAEKVGTEARAELSQRLAPLANAPAEVVRQLARDGDISVAGPVLERSRRLTEVDLIEIARTKSQPHLLAIARRNGLAEEVKDVLLAVASTETRGEVQRALAQAGMEVGERSRQRDYRSAQATVEALRRQGRLDEEKLIEYAKAGHHEEMVATLAEICSVPIEAVDRLMAGERPDPVLVLCKSAGWEWPAAKAVITACPAMGTSGLEAARSNFERLSVASAQRVMRFWRHRGHDRRMQRRPVE